MTSAAPAPAATAPAKAATVSAAALISTTYSTNVGGKNYAGNISQSDGQYTIAVPNVPDSSVTASSLSAAEAALNLRIDTLV